MITLYSYPELFGLPDNNPYGLKIYAFLKLCQMDFVHEHVFDASTAPRGQLPYILDHGESIGDSDAIIAHLIAKYGLTIDSELTAQQRCTDLLIRRSLDDLYWVMSYSRWRDPQFWPLFRDAFLRTHAAALTPAALDAAREYNFSRYHYQGIGRYAPDVVYARGIADLRAVASLFGGNEFLFGTKPTSTDAGLYGFVANVYFYEIETPLREFVCAHPDLVRHCREIHAAVMA